MQGVTVLLSLNEQRGPGARSWKTPRLVSRVCLVDGPDGDTDLFTMRNPVIEVAAISPAAKLGDDGRSAAKEEQPSPEGQRPDRLGRHDGDPAYRSLQ